MWFTPVTTVQTAEQVTSSGHKRLYFNIKAKRIITKIHIQQTCFWFDWFTYQTSVELFWSGSIIALQEAGEPSVSLQRTSCLRTRRPTGERFHWKPLTAKKTSATIES